jgi:FAD:protein FMN transferase
VTPQASRRSWVEQIMGLPVSVLARGGEGGGADSTEADAAVQALFAELHQVDADFSPYRTDSAISRLNRGELQLADSPADVRDVAARCELARLRTGGRFDATRPDGSWDPSGLVKGWAVERAVRLLAGAGTGADWCVNAGGDVIVVAASGQPFTVGIQDPRDPGRLATSLPCAGGAVATSGTAARGAHLYDPRTGAPVVTSWLSVTVTGASLEVADVLATAAFVAAGDWAAVVAAVPGYEGLAIAASGEQSMTSGWPPPS